MRIAFAVTAFLAAALSYGIIALAVMLKIRKFGDAWATFQSIVGVWPDLHWLDLGIVATLLLLGTIFTCTGLSLLKPAN